ncbi:NfeD family protein [Neisseria sp. Ec49-e6-T10]|uniref:NfeD family protein n=1 Tax=Neisseria sp. Ec49-e6-T10 TaxID=3140744 RepID=UPI003EB71CB2
MYWLALGFVLLIFEFFTNTFYLLVICAAFMIAGLSEWLFQTPFYVNTIIASVMSIIGVLIVKKVNKTRKARGQDKALDDLDIGQYVEVTAVEPSGQAVVYYRGAQWQARFDDVTALVQTSEEHLPTRAKIIRKDANILIVEAV